MNEKLLEAHKKVVQSKLNRQVARTIFDSPSEADTSNKDAEAGEGSVSSPRINNNGPAAAQLHKLQAGHNRRFAPHLEGIPEESRANTLNAKAKENEARSVQEGTDDSRKGSTTNSMKKLSTSDPHSLDSGILTRSSSISDLSDSQTDVVTSNSCDFDTDNETVDVADSDDTDTDSDTYVEGSVGASVSCLPVRSVEQKPRHKDFVSELYNTAVSKVPKVIPSDSESLYSSNSTMRKDFEYDSLDINSNCRHKDIYTNPGLVSRGRRGRQQEHGRDDYEEVNVKERNVAEVYINKEYEASTMESGGDEDSEAGYDFSAGEKMMISIGGDNESVYSNKILISVNGTQAVPPAKMFPADSTPAFDPDTLDRKEKKDEAVYGSVDSLETLTPRLPSAHVQEQDGHLRESFFLFPDDKKEKTSPPASSGSPSFPPYSTPAQRKPSLPPKTRLTPRLPPKPSHGQKSSIGQRPLPPPPPPPPHQL